MSARLRAFAGAPLALVVTFVTAAPAQASAIYAYTGNPFTLVTRAGPTAPADLYTTADRVTVFLEMAGPLAPDLAAMTPIAPLSFSFSDGVNTVTNANATGTIFQVATDSAGNIVRWRLNAAIYAFLDGGGTAKNIFTYNYVESAVLWTLDSGLDTLCGPTSVTSRCEYSGDPFYTQAAMSNSARGAWTLRTPVPEPTSTLLIGVALVGFAARRRARRAH